MPPFSLAEIIFLRAVTPAHPANHADIIFDITDGNLRDSFDIIKRYMDGMTVGEWPETSGPSGRGPPPASWPVGDQLSSLLRPILQGPAGTPSSPRVVEPPALGDTPVGLSLPTYQGWINWGRTRSLRLPTVNFRQDPAGQALVPGLGTVPQL